MILVVGVLSSQTARALLPSVALDRSYTGGGAGSITCSPLRALRSGAGSRGLIGSVVTFLPVFDTPVMSKYGTRLQLTLSGETLSLYAISVSGLVDKLLCRRGRGRATTEGTPFYREVNHLPTRSRFSRSLPPRPVSIRTRFAASDHQGCSTRRGATVRTTVRVPAHQLLRR
jgi:hypothetical protein